MNRTTSPRLPFYLPPREAAEYLGVSRRSLDRWRKSGLISCIRMGKRLIRYRRMDLDAMMQAHLCRVRLSEDE